MPNVQAVPTAGISASVGPNAPRMLPRVETAYTCPAARPAVAVSVTASRTTNGETQPSSVMGTAKSTATLSPTTARTAISRLARAKADAIRNISGRTATGTSPAARAAQASSRKKVAGCGERSARRPPST